MIKHTMTLDTPLRVEKELIKAAREFVPEYDFAWAGGCCTATAPYGDYIWHFIVEMKQNQIWNYREFQEGYAFGLNPVEPFRDANPYKEPVRNAAWDCGYILGLHDAEKTEATRKDSENG